MTIPTAFSFLILFVATSTINAGEPLPVWPDLAPGETTKLAGDTLPSRENEQPAITRVENISMPTFTVHAAAEPSGAGVVILPGGGFGKVVPDLEGTEAAAWLNRVGVTAFVLSYRTKADDQAPAWRRPLQDAQRLLSLVRSRAAEWHLIPDRIGLLGFSAGGQVAARLLCDGGERAYERIDAVDEVSHRPNFAILVYPWNLYDVSADELVDGLRVPKDCPPTYLVHTDDDHSSSLGAVLFYMGLKKHSIPAELHVYGNGGHGYGQRPIQGSQIDTWPNHAAHWLARTLKSQAKQPD